MSSFREVYSSMRIVNCRKLGSSSPNAWRLDSSRAVSTEGAIYHPKPLFCHFNHSSLLLERSTLSVLDVLDLDDLTAWSRSAEAICGVMMTRKRMEYSVFLNSLNGDRDSSTPQRWQNHHAESSLTLLM